MCDTAPVCVVSFKQETSTHLSYLNLLPPRYTYEGVDYRLIQVEGSHRELISGEPVEASDYVIRHSLVDDFDSGDYRPFVVTERSIETRRLSKPLQVLWLDEQTKRARQESISAFDGYTTLPSWTRLATVSVADAFPNSLLVIKPVNGARGIGQLYFDTEHVSPMAMQHLLLMADQSNDKKTYLDTNIEQINAKAGREVVVYDSEGDRTPDEGLKVLYGSDGSYIVQEVKRFKYEFRVMTDATGSPLLIASRTLRSFGDQTEKGMKLSKVAADTIAFSPDSTCRYVPRTQALVEWIAKIVDKPEGTRELDTILESAYATIQNLNLPLHSIDLFVTEDGRWGILEFCPEFGLKQTLSAGLVQNEAMRFIHLLATGTSTFRW